MATEIKTWEIVEGHLKPINTTLAENQRKEKEHLEQWIKTKPKIIEEIEIQKANKKKFTIARSDKAGEYDKDQLKELLRKYFNKNLHSARRIKDIMLPALMTGKTVTRNQLLKEFVKSGEAKDQSQAGYFMSLISGQLGHAWKDYLRQIINYEYPNYQWEKDNFKINEEYIEMVKELLEELNQKQ